jgi:hypothetical protein
VRLDRLGTSARRDLKGRPDPPGPPGAPGAAGTTIRMVEVNCRGTCTAECSAEERIVNAYALAPGGSFVYEDDNRASYRPQRRNVDIKVVVAGDIIIMPCLVPGERPQPRGIHVFASHSDSKT